MGGVDWNWSQVWPGLPSTSSPLLASGVLLSTDQPSVRATRISNTA